MTKAMAEKSLFSDWQIILIPPLFVFFQFTYDDSTLRKRNHQKVMKLTVLLRLETAQASPEVATAKGDQKPLLPVDGVVAPHSKGAAATSLSSCRKAVDGGAPVILV